VSAQKTMRAARVFVALVLQAADNRVLVGDLGQARQERVDLDAANVRRRRPEGAAILGGSVRLEIEQVKVAGTAVGPEQDYRKIVTAAASYASAANSSARPGKPPLASAPRLIPPTDSQVRRLSGVGPLHCEERACIFGSLGLPRSAAGCVL
jgi:hypothetical protein